MSATKSLSARTPERHGDAQSQNRVQLEELESRMLLSRGALSSQPPPTALNSAFLSDDSATTAIVVRENAETTSTVAADSTQDSSISNASVTESSAASDTSAANSSPSLETASPVSATTPDRQVTASRAIVSNDEPVAGTATSTDDSQPAPSDPIGPSSMPVKETTPDYSEPILKIELRIRPIGLRRIQVIDDPSPTEPPVRDATAQQDPTPVRPVRPEPASDVEKTDAPATQPTEPATQPAGPAAETGPDKADTETRSDDAPPDTTSEPSPNCVARETARGSVTKCPTQQLALTAQPPAGPQDTQEAAAPDRTNPTSLTEHAAAPESTVIESPQSAALPPRSEPAHAQAATDPLSDLTHPENMLADALTDVLADEHRADKTNEIGQTVFAAGAFAVAFSKPLSRLAGPDGSTLIDPPAPSMIPIMFTRKRRKDSRKSSPGTKDKPDDTDDHDESQHSPRGRGPARKTTAAFDGAERSDAQDHYGSIEAAIHATLQSCRDPSDDSAHAAGVFHSAKSFAAGALVAAAALLTLQGVRRPERSRPTLRPAAPTYHGQTAVAAS